MQRNPHLKLPASSLLLSSIVALSLAGCEALSGESPSMRELSVEPGRRLGNLDDPTVGFTSVGGVEVDRDGNLIVFEASVPEIRVYGPDGSILRRIGRRGPGPGEFESPGAFGVVGDTVWVMDTNSRRLTLYDRGGELLAANAFTPVTVLLPEIHGLVMPHSLQPDGTFSSSLSMIVYQRGQPPTGVEPDDSIPVPIVRFASSGSVIDTIGWLGRPPPRMWRRPQEQGPALRTIEHNGRRIIIPSPPPTSPHWEALPDGFIEVDFEYATSAAGAEFHVRRIGLNNDTIYDRAIPYEPEPYASEELDALAESAAKGQGGGVFSFPAGSAPAVPDDWTQAVPRIRQAMDFPAYKLPVQYSWLSQDQSLWIRLADGAQGSGRWLILDREGRPKGQLRLPTGTRVVWNRGDAFWAVIPDEMDVPWLVEHTIVGL